MALLDLCHHIRPECVPLQPLLVHLSAALHPVPGDLDCHDPSSGTVTLSRHFPYGSRDNRQHGNLCVRPGLGTLGHQACKYAIAPPM